MKKIITIAAAMCAATTMYAGIYVPATQVTRGEQQTLAVYADEPVEYIEFDVSFEGAEFAGCVNEQVGNVIADDYGYYAHVSASFSNATNADEPLLYINIHVTDDDRNAVEVWIDGITYTIAGDTLTQDYYETVLPIGKTTGIRQTRVEYERDYSIYGTPTNGKGISVANGKVFIR